MRHILSCIAIIGLLLFQNNHVRAQDNKDIDKNTKYLIESIDTENKKFSPGKPENKFQEVMADYMGTLMDLNTKTQKAIQLIGPIEFKKMFDLAEAKNIIIYRENLRQYIRVKKDHYDTLDVLMKTANTQIGKEHLNKTRLGGSTQYYEEKLELFYLYDLDRYYEFLINNHNHFVFKDEEIYGTDDQILKQYNILREKMAKSAENINKTYALKNNLLKDRMSELKEWVKQN